MNIWVRIMVGLTAWMFSGCASIRILDHAIPANGNVTALIVYAENPAELVQTGKDDLNNPVYGPFENWLRDAFSSRCDKLHYDYFKPQTVLAFAKNHGVQPLECPLLNKDGKPTKEPSLYSFPNSALPGLFDTAKDLGATYVIKAQLINYDRKEYYRSDKVKGDFTRVDVTVEITAYHIPDPKPLFHNSFTVSEDNSSLIGELYGGGNVKKELAEAVLKEIRAEK